MLSFLLNRLREPSSWVGLATIAAQAADALATRDPMKIAVVLGGVAAVVMPEASSKPVK